MSWTRIIPRVWTPVTIINSTSDIKKNTKWVDNHYKLSLKERVKEQVMKQATLARRERGKSEMRVVTPTWNLDEAYDRCVEMAAKDLTSVITNQPIESSSFGSKFSSLVKTLLLTLSVQEELNAVAALAVWCRRTDELVDGSNRNITESETLQKWEQRLIDTFQGKPSDLCDAALYDTITTYQVDIQLFKDLIEGMRLDLNKQTYENFDELSLYSYYATGTPVLMCIQVLGFQPKSKASFERYSDSILSFAVALQLTDILRDISEDARMGRIYLPQDELLSAGISSDDILNERVTDTWRKFMKEQIERVRTCFKESEVFIKELKPRERWFFWWLSLLYKELLDNIEVNDYNFTSETSVGVTKLLKTLLLAHWKNLAQQIFNSV